MHAAGPGLRSLFFSLMNAASLKDARNRIQNSKLRVSVCNLACSSASLPAFLDTAFPGDSKPQNKGSE
eukprot:231598-Pelagomonas_calceolata.AAC.14